MPTTQRWTKTWTEADARRLVDELDHSGLDLYAFARQRGFIPQRLAWWRKRLDRKPRSSAALVLAPARVVESPALAGAALRLPNGVVLEIATATPQWIAAVICELLEPR